MCAVWSQITSESGSVCSLMAIWLVMVPEGQKRPASLPKSCAQRLFQGVYGRVFAVYIVAGFGLKHEFQHGFSGFGNGIGTEID